MSEVTHGIVTVRDSHSPGYVEVVMGSKRDGRVAFDTHMTDIRDLVAALGHYLALESVREHHCCEHGSDAHDASGCLDCKCHMAPWSPGFNPTEARA
jgi:hypothetical protein